MREALATALEPEHQYHAGLLAQPETEITVYEAPFLSRYKIYQVEHFGRIKPTVFYVAFARPGEAFLLTGEPKAFVEMAHADGVTISSPDAALGYALAFLESTRSMADVFYVVRKPDDFLFRPNLDAHANRVRTGFIAKWGGRVAPTAIRVENGNYTVKVFVVRGQSFEEHDLDVKASGNLEDAVTVLKRDLPLVYGH